MQTSEQITVPGETGDAYAANRSLMAALVPLKDMMPANMDALLEYAVTEMVCRGQVLFEYGSYDNDCVYLLHGDLELVGADGNKQLVKGRSNLLPVSPEQPRAFTATALTDCNVLKINSEKLDKLLTWSQISEYLAIDFSYQTDMDEDNEWISTILKSNLFFKVPPINLPDVFKQLKPMVVDAGEVILRQGEIGDGCYFIKEGDAVVSRSVDDGKGSQPIANITVGRCFGEDALVNETVRNATVTMKTSGVLMRMEKSDFIQLLRPRSVEQIKYQDIDSDAADLVVIDVRSEEEYAQGHLFKAINIPLNLLRLKIRQLDPSKQYVAYCNTGRRSEAATYLLTQQNYTTRWLSGGLNALRLGAEQYSGDDYILSHGVVVKGQ